MKICVIGAGISGMSVAQLLKKKHQVVVFEKDSEIGGIAKTKQVDGFTYHTVGGHCFNSTIQTVLDFVFQEIMPFDQWHLVPRNANIFFHGHYIPYPIEFAIRNIGHFDTRLAYDIIYEIMTTKESETDNLSDWLTNKFGSTLANEYFIPYNQKIWNRNPRELKLMWLEGKLPIPDKIDIFRALIKPQKDVMPHRTFYYPNSNNQNTFIEALSVGLEIITNYSVNRIGQRDNSWVINNEFTFDLVISTIPLNIIPFIIDDTPSTVKENAGKLKYNKVTTMFWESRPTAATWTYYPSSDTIFHRQIHIGNFFNPQKTYTITESTGSHDYEEMIHYGKKAGNLNKPLSYNLSDHAYVVFDEHYKTATKIIKNYLHEIGLFTLGRFGEWKYYNMDICIDRAIKLAQFINESDS